MTKPPVQNLEWKIIQAYVSLAVAQKGADGANTATLARYGSYEVRLIELTSEQRDHAAPFRLELFDQKNKTPLDSHASYRLEELAGAAEVLISTAKSLHEKESA